MAFITGGELFDMVIMTLAVGFIFKDFFKKPQHMIESLTDLKKVARDNYKFAILVTAPAIIFHELGHKFVAMGFGAEATFHAAYLWLGIGVALSLFRTGFIFFVPAFVAHSGVAFPWQSALIAFAGPAVNLLIWVGVIGYLKYAKTAKIKLSMNTLAALMITKKINMFLFIFNMIPLGFFDGAHVLRGLMATFGG